MQWRAWATLGPALWCAAVTALPKSTAPIADDNNRGVSNVPWTDPTLKDPLWLKYGLNASAEYKYFHEPGRDDILGHYDSRYFTAPVSDSERADTLTHMVRAYLNFFDENDLETWIAHGTLLGWWWNGKVSTRLRLSSWGGVDRGKKQGSLVLRAANHDCPVTDSSMGLGYGHPSPRYYPRLSGRPLQSNRRWICSAWNAGQARLFTGYQPVVATTRARPRIEYYRCAIHRHQDGSLHRHHGNQSS